MNNDIFSIINNKYSTSFLKLSSYLGKNDSKDNKNNDKNDTDNKKRKSRKECRYLLKSPYAFQFHRKHSYAFAVAVFLIVNYSQFHHELIKCVNYFNNKETVRDDLVNVCLSYPFILQCDNNNISKWEQPQQQQQPPGFSREAPRIYILYYRWIHWIMFLISVIYGLLGQITTTNENLPQNLLIITHVYENKEKRDKSERNMQIENSGNSSSSSSSTPQKCNKKIKKNNSKFFQQQQQQQDREEETLSSAFLDSKNVGDKEEEEYNNNKTSKIDKYFIDPNDIKIISGWLRKTIFSLLVYIFADITIFYFLNYYIFHNKFLTLPISSYPYERNVPYFTDYISRLFPPFAYCEIEDVHELHNGRNDIFGCHLTHMELYEKVFFIFWIWLSIAILMALVSLFNILLYFSPIKRWGLWRQLRSEDKLISYTINRALFRDLSFADVYFLNHCRDFLNREEFIILFFKYIKEKLP
uniref:Innexin n=1 Tax=Armadillidium vulgare clopovirus TaxID=2984284 RepID=A0A9C7F8J9_9VIRU|nr:MAG: hypothetical protein [Armadillidium vulgare clopovirus]